VLNSGKGKTKGGNGLAEMESQKQVGEKIRKQKEMETRKHVEGKSKICVSKEWGEEEK
jgi:hypothetical protein